MQGLEEFVGQLQVGLHPALARGVSQVQVQPEELLAVLGVLQGLQGFGRVQFAAPFAGAKAETVEQAEQIGITVTLVDAVVHGVSQEGQCLARVSQVHLSPIMARLFDIFVTF